MIVSDKMMAMKLKQESRRMDEGKNGRKLVLGSIMLAGIMAGCSGSAVPQRGTAPSSEVRTAQAEAASSQEQAEGACGPSDLEALSGDIRGRCLSANDIHGCVGQMIREACPDGMVFKQTAGANMGPLREGAVAYHSSIGGLVLTNHVEITVRAMDSQGVDFGWSVRPDDRQTALNLADLMDISLEEAARRVEGMQRDGGRSGSFRADFSGNIRGNTGILSDIGLENFRVYQDEHGAVRWDASR